MSQTYKVLSDFYDRVTKREYKAGDSYPAKGTKANVFWINSLISGQNRAKRAFLKPVKVVDAKDAVPQKPAPERALEPETVDEPTPAPEPAETEPPTTADKEFEHLRSLAKARRIKGWALMRSSDTLRAALKRYEAENAKS